MDKTPQELKKRTKVFARRIIRLYVSLPKDTVAQVLGRQMRRSGTSVGVNYREANYGRSKSEFVSKMGDSLKELEETSYWLELLADECIVRRDKMELLLDETSQLNAIFTAIIKKSRGSP
ncbi:MAG: four helix bundle protein [Verrucomicrobiota bacterium]